MQLKEIVERNDTLLEQLFHLWEGSVKATHTFLSQSEIEAIAPYVPEGLKGIPQLFVTFMGFVVTSRSELDEQGNPYPILHMQHG